ncbi:MULTISPECIES: APC family permease [Streptomyces]|uniref:APC family permease n=1 Tax=Streptomyces TaxID=1883 RepID=UPI0015FD80AD|nr:APC family permease [Streptomyces sp. GMR22]MBA6434331.1 APC family permease [Streptomyces sp. GMR22]
MPESQIHPSGSLTRQIAFLPLVGVIFFNVSGGAYSLEEMISSTGPGLGILLLLLVPLVYGIPIAAITTELATAIPADGGTYEWTKRTMGGFMAFQAGLVRWVNSWIDMAVYPVLFASYLATLFPSIAEGKYVLLEAGPFTLDANWALGVLLVVLPLAVLNIRGAKSVGDSALLFSVFAIAPLAIIAILGIWEVFTNGIDPLTPFTPAGTSGPDALAVGLSFTMWCYCGFDQVAQIAGEIEQPARVIPKAMSVSMIVIVASYTLPLLGALAVPGWETWIPGSFGDVALVLGGKWLQIFVTVGGMFCAIGLYSSLLMTSSRSPFVLSRDRWISPAFARQTKRTGSPFVAIIVSSMIYSLFSAGAFTTLIALDVFFINLLLLLNLAALVILRRRNPEMPRPAKIPGGTVGLAVLAVPFTASVVYLMYLQYLDYGTASYVYLGAALALFVLAYFPARAYQRRHGGPVADATPKHEAPSSAQENPIVDV